MKGTGGNQFIPAGATLADLLSQIWRQVDHLADYAEESGRTLDIGNLNIETTRSKSGQISVEVSSELGAS